jgi:hypothetical protein
MELPACGKQCILDAGTGIYPYGRLRFELSRSVKNWEFKYLENVVTLLNYLPLSVLRSQQFRWNKGAEISKNALRTHNQSLLD